MSKIARVCPVVMGRRINVLPIEGAEFLTDGGLENWTSDTNLTSWTETIAGTSTIGKEATIKNSGNFACNFVVDAGNDNAGIVQGAFTAGIWYKARAWMRSLTGAPVVYMGPNTTTGGTFILSTSFTQLLKTFRAPDTTGLRINRTTAGGLTFYADDASVKPLTLASLFAKPKYMAADAVAKVDLIFDATSLVQGGLALRVDSPTAPDNFIIVYYNRSDGKIYTDKHTTGGGWANVGSTTKAYVAGATLQVTVNGNSVDILYNGSAVGSTLTVSDAGIVSNTLYQLFATSPTVFFKNFQVA